MFLAKKVSETVFSMGPRTVPLAGSLTRHSHVNHSVERTDTRIVELDASNSVHPSPDIPEESKLVAGG
jgi:hypothetical protein